MAVNTQTPLAEVVADRRPQFVPLTDDVLRVARRYAERKHELNAMDFDDLLLNWKILLAEREPVRRALAERFQHVLVDEYQDTNRLQGDVVDLLVAGHRNLCVVGDDAQSIYSFRGAHFENILEFEKRYPDARRFDLTVNYRSTPQILALANASIAGNVRQFEKELASVRRDGTLPALVPCRDVVQQAAFVAQRVLELRDEGIPLPEIAVLYRAHHHSMEIQFELARRGIPFVVRSGVRFFEAAHVKDVLAHLRFARNPGDELALKRCLKITPGVGTATAEAVWAAFAARRRGGRGAVEELLAPDVATQVPGKGRPGYTRLAQLLQTISRPPTDDLPGEAIEEVLDQGYEEYLRAEFLNADAAHRGHPASWPSTPAATRTPRPSWPRSRCSPSCPPRRWPRVASRTRRWSSPPSTRPRGWSGGRCSWSGWPTAASPPPRRSRTRRARRRSGGSSTWPARGPRTSSTWSTRWWRRRATGSGWCSRPPASSRSCRREPELLERWQLDEPGGAVPLPAGAPPRAGPARPAGRAGPVRPARRRGRGRARRRGGGDGGGEDVPF